MAQKASRRSIGASAIRAKITRDFSKISSSSLLTKSLRTRSPTCSSVRSRRKMASTTLTARTRIRARPMWTWQAASLKILKTSAAPLQRQTMVTKSTSIRSWSPEAKIRATIPCKFMATNHRICKKIKPLASTWRRKATCHQVPSRRKWMAVVSRN